MSDQVKQMENALELIQASAVADPIRAKLMRDFAAVSQRINEYAASAANLEVNDEETARQGAHLERAIMDDIAAIKSHEVLEKIIAGLHTLHRTWTGIRGRFIEPLEEARGVVRRKVIAWTQAEREKIEAERRRLQELANARAAETGTPAAKVDLPVPAAPIRTSRVWQAAVADEDAFFQALAKEPGLRGFVKIELTKLARAKAANQTLEIKGIDFQQIIR